MLGLALVGNAAKFPLKQIYWKPGAIIEKFFVAAGEYAVVPAEDDPPEQDFRPVAEQVFVLEHTSNFDIEEIDGLRVGIPTERASEFAEEAVFWLTRYAKACYSPNDDYDDDSQEEDFDDSISRLSLELRGNIISTDWKFSEVKNIVGRIVSARAAGNASKIRRAVSRYRVLPTNQEHKVFNRKQRRRNYRQVEGSIGNTSENRRPHLSQVTLELSASEK